MARMAGEIDDSAPVTYGELRAAVAAEREACARVAEQSRTSYFDEDGVCNNPGADIAALIRKRK